ncbi:MAG TPA: LLM class flavin-dependent oxidoreductase [Chloroflexota bacterium]|nr:LLM class flavin-dependent oxidoreductase [Chloroflexota bacterium]
MDFGLALDFGTNRATLDKVLDEYVPLLKLAEEHGFHSVVAGQSFPGRGGSFHVASPFLVLAALAPRTSLRLGTGVTLQPAWHPLNLAYDGAILDQLSGGRFFMGISVANPGDWDRFGMPRETIGRRFDELLQAMKALWSGADGYEGELVKVKQAIHPLPIQPGGPPILVGGLSPRAARRAAAYADGYYAATQYRLGAVGDQVGRYKTALREAGKSADRPEVAINRLCCVAETDEQAVNEGRPYVTKVLRAYASRGALAGETADHLQLLERTMGDVCLVGSPDTVRRQMEAYAQAGVTRFELRVAPGDMPAEMVARTIRLVGEHVIPSIQ